MRYQNIRSASFTFVATHACDGQTDGQTNRQNYDFQDRAIGIAVRAVIKYVKCSPVGTTLSIVGRIWNEKRRECWMMGMKMTKSDTT